MDSFPSRKEILDQKQSQSYQDNVVDSIKSIDISKFDFKGSFKPRSEITEKQKVFIWIRLFLNDEEHDVKPDDIVVITYALSGEELETKFICFSKKGMDKDSNELVVTNFSKEDDRKVLCLMIDADRIGANSEDIPYIRTLFGESKYFEFQLTKRDELIFINKSNGKKFEYYDVSF